MEWVHDGSTRHRWVAEAPPSGPRVRGRESAALFGHGLACLPGVPLAGVLADKHSRVALWAAFRVDRGVPSHDRRDAARTRRGGSRCRGLGNGVRSRNRRLLQVVATRSSGRPDTAPAAVNAMFNVGIATGARAGGAVLARSIEMLACTEAGVVTPVLALSALVPESVERSPVVRGASTSAATRAVT